MAAQKQRSLTLVLLIFQLFTINLAEPYIKQLTIFIDAGRYECFYQPVALGEKIVVEYQVIDGAHGELNINFLMLNSQRKLIIKDMKLETKRHEHLVPEDGIYSVCFDNAFSTFNRKTVSFLLEVTAANVNDTKREEDKQVPKESSKGYHVDQAMNNIIGRLKNIQVNLMRSRQLQNLLRTHEARDRNLAESNFILVTVWSVVQFVTMILVGLLQVFMLRSIFDTGGRFYNFWKSL